MKKFFLPCLTIALLSTAISLHGSQQKALAVVPLDQFSDSLQTKPAFSVCKTELSKLWEQIPTAHEFAPIKEGIKTATSNLKKDLSKDSEDYYMYKHAKNRTVLLFAGAYLFHHGNKLLTNIGLRAQTTAEKKE